MLPNKPLALILLAMGLVSACAPQKQYKVTGTTMDTIPCQVSSTLCIEMHTFRPIDYEKDEMLITYDSQTSAETADDILKKYKLRPRRSDKLDSIKTTMITATTNGQDPYELVSTIKKQENVVDAATSSFYATANIPATTTTSYPLGMTGANAARTHTGGKGIVIGMIDTPIDMTYGDSLSADIERIELVRPGNEQNRLHGTEVAGVLISQNPRIGIAPEAKLLAISAFSSNPANPNEHRSNTGQIARAMEIAIREKVDILNLSFTGKPDPLIEKLVNAALQQGIVVVASAGNGGPNAQPAYPAAIPGVIAVTAVDKGEQVFRQANRGDYIDLAAPGVGILTTAPRGSFHVSSGTSLATAHATGIIALLMSLNRQGFNPNLLNQTAIDLGAPGHDRDYGYGLLSANRALGAIGIH